MKPSNKSRQRLKKKKCSFSTSKPAFACARKIGGMHAAISALDTVDTFLPQSHTTKIARHKRGQSVDTAVGCESTLHRDSALRDFGAAAVLHVQLFSNYNHKTSTTVASRVRGCRSTDRVRPNKTHQITRPPPPSHPQPPTVKVAPQARPAKIPTVGFTHLPERPLEHLRQRLLEAIDVVLDHALLVVKVLCLHQAHQRQIAASIGGTGRGKGGRRRTCTQQ